jgi:hypothetical protein
LQHLTPSARVADLLRHPFFSRSLRPTRGRPARPVVRLGENDCILWCGAVNSKGYGMAAHGSAHRQAYATFVGETPPGSEIHHMCRNKLCVNPDHLDCLTRDEHAALEGRPIKLDHEQVRAMLRDIVAGVPHGEIARRFDISRPYVSLVKFGHRWAPTVREFWREMGTDPVDARIVDAAKAA